MRRLAEQVRLAATLNTPVTLVGEEGSGKESVARVLHFQSPRREQAFAALDCARLPPDAVADLLTAPHGGPLRAAGSLYLHEPQHLPHDLQTELAAAVGRSGSARLFVGVCGDLDDASLAARFSADFWCAVSVLVLRVPPLRDRRADLPLLVERFLLRAAPLVETPVRELTPAAWEVLHAYSWPGNLRELYAALSSACLAATSGIIDAEHLPAPLRLSQRLAESSDADDERPIPLDDLLKQTERRLIQLALQRARGNKTRAAELLGVWRPRLMRRMVALGLIEAEPLAELELEEDE
jgi:DNA-binding NtrC family response regulator